MDDHQQALVLVMQAGGCDFGLSLSHVREVMRPLPVRAIAGSEDMVLGAAVIRAVPVPVVSLARLLGAPPMPADARARFVAVSAGGRPVALAVDAVHGVRAVTPTDLHAMPALLNAVRTELIDTLSMIDADMVILLRGARLLPDTALPVAWEQAVQEAA